VYNQKIFFTREITSGELAKVKHCRPTVAFIVWYIARILLRRLSPILYQNFSALQTRTTKVANAWNAVSSIPQVWNQNRAQLPPSLSFRA